MVVGTKTLHRVNSIISGSYHLPCHSEGAWDGVAKQGRTFVSRETYSARGGNSSAMALPRSSVTTVSWNGNDTQDPSEVALAMVLSSSTSTSRGAFRNGITEVIGRCRAGQGGTYHA